MKSQIMDVVGDRALDLGPKPAAEQPYQNFKLTRDADGIAWLLFDREGASANTLSADLIEELELVLTALENQRPAGLRLRAEFEHAVAENVHDPAIHDHTVSISMAPPSPPPMHSVATPRLVPSRFIALTRCSTMRLPLQPTGWPRLMAPPSTLSFV